MFKIDKENRKIIITDEVSRKVIEIREGEALIRKFLEGTQDKYKCVLKLIEVDIINPKTGEKTGNKETKAFAQRENNEGWLMEFVEEEYNYA